MKFHFQFSIFIKFYKIFISFNGKLSCRADTWLCTKQIEAKKSSQCTTYMVQRKNKCNLPATPTLSIIKLCTFSYFRPRHSYAEFYQMESKFHWDILTFFSILSMPFSCSHTEQESSTSEKPDLRKKWNHNKKIRVSTLKPYLK